MTNASRCRATAAHYARLAQAAGDARRRNAYAKLQQLWTELAALAEKFDRGTDDLVKARIYAKMDAVEVARRQAA